MLCSSLNGHVNAIRHDSLTYFEQYFDFEKSKKKQKKKTLVIEYIGAMNISNDRAVGLAAASGILVSARVLTFR